MSRYRHAGANVDRKYSSYSFFTSAPDGMSGQRHAPAALYPWEWTPGAHWIGGWVGPRVVSTQRLEEKSFASAMDGSPVVQSVVRHYAG
jgi:anti-sigma factor RsiW